MILDWTNNKNDRTAKRFYLDQEYSGYPTKRLLFMVPPRIQNPSSFPNFSANSISLLIQTCYGFQYSNGRFRSSFPTLICHPIAPISIICFCSSKFQLPIHGTSTSIQTLPFRPPPALARRSTPHPFLSHPTLNSIIQPSPPPSVTLLPHKQLISLSYSLDRRQQHPSTATRLSSSLSSSSSRRFGRHLARAWLFCP